MKNLILGLLLSFTGAQASATSLHPCTPTVALTPFQMTCTVNEKEIAYVNIATLMSNISPACPYENRVEIVTVSVDYYDRQSKKQLSSVKIFDGNYELQLDNPNGVQFSSPRHNIKFKRCQVPSNGGVSMGN